MQSSNQNRWLWHFLLIFGILSATLLAYFPATQCGFIWDDDDYVIENATLRDFAGLKSIWLEPTATPQYYPLVHSSFWCEYQTWGLSAGGYHVTNILFHAVNALLLWRLLVRLHVPGAWLAALVFAVHPVHVESVAWITERKNVLSGMFYLLSVHCFIRYWDFTQSIDESVATSQKNNHRWLWFAVAHLCFIAALLSKTVTATLPAVLLVLIWWQQGRIPVRKSLALLPMLLVGIVFGLMTVWLEKFQVGAKGMDWNLTLVERCLIAGRALWFYAGKLVWPVPLIFTYPRWSIDSSQTWQWLFPLAAIAVMVGLWLLQSRMGRGPLAAVLLFAGTLFPALGFLDVYPMRFSFVADHFQYLASIAVITLSVSAATTLAASRFSESGQLLRFLAGCLILVLMGLTWRQTFIYEGLEPLWRDTLAKNPDSFMAHNNLGSLLIKRGDYAEAEQHIRDAMRIKPDFVDSVVNMGKVRESQGDIDGAMRYYRQANQMNPKFAPALNGIGAMYGAKGDLQTAEQYFQKAVEVDGKYVSARDNLIKAYIALQKFDKAETLLEQVLGARPNDTDLLGTLGVLNANQQQYRDAIMYFERVLQLVPNEPNALHWLAQMHDALGETEAARAYATALEKTQATNQ